MEIVNFLRDNWSFISFGLVILFELVILLVKRNKTIVSDNSIISTLIPIVNEAEKLFGAGHGQEKLEYVVKVFNETYSAYKLSDKVIALFVESILSTPEKKGAFDEKVK